MKKGKLAGDTIWKHFSIFNTGWSIFEKIGGVFTFLFIAGSSTATAFLAKVDPVLKELGPIYWIGIGVCLAAFLSLIFYLLKSASFRQSQADYYARLAIPKNSINPLADSFMDLIIHVEDLRLPIMQMHERKYFKRCKFIGAGSVAILGGHIDNNEFSECADIIAVAEGTAVSGVVVFKDCTVHDCEFVHITILADQRTGKAFSDAGASVKGLIEQ